MRLKLLFITITLFVVCGSSYGQVTIFNETLGTVTTTTAINAHEIADGFDNDSFTMTSGGATNPADLRSTNPSSGSGSSNVWFTTTNNQYGFAIEGINTSGYTALTLDYSYRKDSSTSHATFAVEYWNGSSWINIANSSSTLFNETNVAAINWYAAKQLALPIGAQIADLKIRFLKSGIIGIRIDDIVLKGTLSGSTTPTLTTPTATSITTTTATLGATVTADGGSTITERGIEWSTTSGFANGTGTTVSTSGSFGTGTFTQAVTGLPSSKVIYYKAFATNLTDTGHSAQGSFTTLGPEINITNNTPSSIPTGSTANTGYNTEFASTVIGTSTAAKTYRIYNLGSSTLNVSAVTSSNPTEFTITSSSPYAIAPGAYVSFTVIFSPLNSGTRTAVISIANDDSTNDGSSTENPYTFYLKGDGTCPTNTNTITPTSGPAGTEVTITSSNSSTNILTAATVTFNGVAATSITYVSSTQIKVIVPSGATSGNLVTTNATGCTATNTFTLIDNKANTCQGGTAASDLFISEVTDATTGGLSYVEIYNGTSVAINMNGYSLKTYFNGSSTATNILPLNNFSLNPGSIYIVAIGTTASPDASNSCSIIGGNGSFANQTSTSAGVNFDTSGNDCIALYKISTSSTIDVFGTLGSDTWADGLGLGDRGATFRRKNTASLPSTTYSNSDWNITDWVGTAQASCNTNDYSDIGTYNFISGTPPTITLHPSYTPTCKATTLTVAGTEGYTGGNSLTYKWLVSAPNTTGWTELSDVGIYTGTSSETLSITDISGVIDYQYYCQIRENTNTCYAASNAVKITNGAVATWNGSWTNGPPTLDKLVIINADYDTSINGSYSACSVVVNAGKTVTITADEYVKIQNDLTNNGTVNIENDGSLVQINDNGINSGVIRYERTTPPIFRTDYTYWTSPVSGYTLGGVSQNLTLSDKYYSYDSTAEEWKQESSAINMMAGIGYIIRGPETPFQNPFDAFFVGVPNNGEYSIAGVTIDKSYLLGNPYPSALDADTFLAANSDVLDGTLYFWTHKTPLSLATNIPNPGLGWAYTYSLNDYAAYNLTGGVGIDDSILGAGGYAAPNGSTIPTGKIASGQGFFASSKTTISGTDIIFNNSMRVGVVDILEENNSQFFKTRNPTTKTELTEKHRIWLNLKNTQGAFKQTLIGYLTNATNAYDSRFDGESFDANEFVDFYSVNQDKNLVIQGRALPFNENDEVPLGFRTTIEGDFTINIDQVDGLLTNQAVFIEDKLTNTVFNLKRGNYTFNTVAGTFNERFILRYTNKTLGTNDLETLENQVLVSNKNKQIKVNSDFETIDKVLVYDLLGRQLFKKEKVNSSELVITNLVSSQQTLLVKVALQNGQTVTRKVMY